MPGLEDKYVVSCVTKHHFPLPPRLPADKKPRYHWALIVGPKDATGDGPAVRYDVRQRLRNVRDPPTVHLFWEFEELDVPMRPASMLLVLVVVGKVTDAGRLRAIFRSTPLRDEDGWNCVAWVKEAFEAAVCDGKALGTAASSWQSVRDAVMRYIGEKTAAHRFDTDNYDADRVPTWDMLKGIELEP
jgi:hypothetical protein